MKKLFMLAIFAAALVGVAQDSIEPDALFDDEKETDTEVALDRLQEFLLRPLDVNRADEAQLRSLPTLAAAAAEIVAYRRKNGAFRSLEELKKVKGVRPVFEEVRPYLTAEPVPPAPELSLRGRWLPPARQADGTTFVNSKIYHRLTVKRAGLGEGNLLLEKDAGEALPADRLSGSILLELPLKARLILGDFTAEFGRQLVFGGPYFFGKSADPIAAALCRRSGLFPNRSANENLPFRGVGLAWERGPLRLSLLHSDKRRDARIVDGTVRALPNDGLHRTPSERETRNRLREFSDGAVVEWRGRTFKAGAAWLRNRFDHELALKSRTPFAFEGGSHMVSAMFGSVSLGEMTLFGEYAADDQRAKAGIIGTSLAVDPLHWVMLYRRYAPDFYSLYASAFGAGDEATNERGFYIGGRCRIKRSVFSFYADLFEPIFPETGRASAGNELGLSFQERLSPRLVLSLRLKAKRKAFYAAAADTFGNRLLRQTVEQRNSVRLQADFRPNRMLSLRSRLEWTRAPAGGLALNKGAGVLLSQQADVAGKSSRLNLRWTVFDAPAYPLRLYQIESDGPGALTLKLLYGRGVRCSVGGSIRVGRHLQLSAKAGQTVYEFRPTDGPGSEADFSLQVDWRR